jgi:polyisoprenoid-binding protein YceI
MTRLSTPSFATLATRATLATLSVALATLGCAGVQRAAIDAPMVASVPSTPSASNEAKPDGTEAPRRSAEKQRNIVRPDGSSIEVTSSTLFASFDSRITRFRGLIDVDAHQPTRGRLVIDFDMTSFENPSKMITAILQHEFLEIDTYPQARLDATFGPTNGPSDERLVQGVLDLHGVRRTVSFRGILTREGNDYRFKSAFDLDRHPFGIRQHDEWDWLNKSDFRVRINLRGTPERVRVEELP